MKQKAQGAIEYLLVIGAVILVVAVVIIALSGTLTDTRDSVDKNEISNMNDPLHNLLKPDFCSNEGEEICNPDKTYKICTNEKWVNFNASVNHCEVECLENDCDGINFVECSNFTLQQPRIKSGECGATCEIGGTETCTTQLCGPGTKSYTCSNGQITYTSACIANTPQCNGSAPTCTNYLTLQTCSEEKCIQTTNALPGEICVTNSFLKKFDSGFGTTINPYKISTCQELQNINLALDKNFELNNSIYCSGFSFQSIGTCGTGNCGGTDAYDDIAFTGSINGNNYIINNITITANKSSNGLFSYIKNAKIKNLIIASGNINGTKYSGAFSGYCENASLENVKNSATINGYLTGGICGQADMSTINGGINTGLIKGTNSGGLFGYCSNSNVSNSFNTGIIENYSVSTSNSSGGIIGVGIACNIAQVYNSGTLKATYAQRRGGIAGYALNTYIKNSFSTGTIENANDINGGIIGRNYTTGTVTNSYWYSTTNITACCGVTSCSTSCYKNTQPNLFYAHNISTQQHLVYYGSPNWDNNWIWTGSALPKLSWQP